MNLILYMAIKHKTTVYRWYADFKRGRTALIGEFQEGRKKLVVLPETIDAVSKLMMPGFHLTYRELEASLGIISTYRHLILHAHLAVKKLCLR